MYLEKFLNFDLRLNVVKGLKFLNKINYNIFIVTNSELTLNAVSDIIRQKAIKRNLSLKIFDYGEIEIVSGNKVKQTILLKQGIKQEIAKKISKSIRDQIKKINVSIVA